MRDRAHAQARTLSMWRLAVPACCALITLAAPATAAAGVLSVEGEGNQRTLAYRSEPRETDSIHIYATRGAFTSYDSEDTAGPGCFKSQFEVTCARAGVARVVVRLGDGDDHTFLWLREGPSLLVQAYGGTGDDRIERYAGGREGTRGRTILHGQAGDDTLLGSDWGSELRGGRGDDRLEGGFGIDEFHGGRGTDIVSYVKRHYDRIRIVLDGRGPDGPAGDEDVVAKDVEGAIGGGAADDNVLTGNGGANLLHGGISEDTLTGRGGRDTLIGASGDDKILARDGQADIVACGPDLDVAYVDRRDDVSAQCERIVVGPPR